MPNQKRDRLARRKRPREDPEALQVPPRSEGRVNDSSDAHASIIPEIAAVTLPRPKQVQALCESAQMDFVARSAALCERAIYCIDAGITTLHRSNAREAAGENGSGNRNSLATGRSNSASVEDAVLSDMVRLRDLPVAQEFVEITLWRRLRNAASKAVTSVEAVCASLETKKGGASKGTAVTEPEIENTSSAPKSFQSFKQCHMQTLTDVFAADLEKLRRDECMDGDRVQFLLQCLDAGADLFAALSVDVDDGSCSIRTNKGSDDHNPEEDS